MTLYPKHPDALGGSTPSDPYAPGRERSWVNRLCRPIDQLGALVIAGWFSLADLAGLSVAIVMLAARPGTWRRTVRRELIRQCYLSAVAAMPMIVLLSALVGVAVVSQVLNLFRLVGQDAMIGQFMAYVLAREIAPAMVGLLLVGRSGTAIIAELSMLRVNGQIKTLDAAGVDPVVYLVLPRVLGLVVASVGLTIVFIAGAFFFGFAVAMLMGYDRGNLGSSAFAAAGSITTGDYLVVVIKALVIGLLIGVICCRRALAVSAVTQLPKSLASGFIWSVLMVFVVSGLVTVIWEMLI